MVDQGLQRLQVRVFLVRRHAVGGEMRLFLVRDALLDFAPGYAYDRGARRHFLQHHRVRTDPRAVADGEAAEHLGARANHYALAERRVALGAAIQRSAAERHALVNSAVVADFRRLADHYAHAVIDEDAPADLHRRMDLDAGEPAADVRAEAAGPAQAVRPQPVADAVEEDGVQAGVAGQHFPGRARGRIALEHAGDVIT